MRRFTQITTLAAAIAAASAPCVSQGKSSVETFFQQNVGLNQDQITAIRNGQAVAKALPSRKRDEVFLFDAVYVHAAPEAYAQYARL